MAKTETVTVAQTVSPERAMQFSFGLTDVDPVEAETLASILRSAQRQETHWRLCLAVLEEAFVTIHKYKRSTVEKHRLAYLDAKSWVCSDDVDWPFAFCVVCETLDMDPEYIRSGLARACGGRWNNGHVEPRSSVFIYPLNIAH